MNESEDGDAPENGTGGVQAAQSATGLEAATLSEDENGDMSESESSDDSFGETELMHGVTCANNIINLTAPTQIADSGTRVPSRYRTFPPVLR